MVQAEIPRVEKGPGQSVARGGRCEKWGCWRLSLPTNYESDTVY
jgi:hypothetical protein